MKKLLVIGKVWPEPQSSAAGTRILQLLELFKEANFEMHFASAAQMGEFSEPLQSKNITCQSIQLNDESFDVYVKSLSPDIVLFDRFTSEEQFGWRVAQFCPNALRILDTEDLHALRAARENSLKQNTEFSNLDLHCDIMNRELAAIYRSDLTLIISKFEMDLLKTHFKIDPQLLHYLPLFAEVPDEKEQLALPTFEARKNFISIGNFLHAPNRDAVKYLKTDIWPIIRQSLPEAELHIYGAYPDDKIFQLHDKKTGFLIKGRAENVNEVMKNARTCLAPLRFGAGLKGKLQLAMQNGTPNITTKIGAEGMHADLAWSGIIGTSAHEIAEAAIQLYQDKSSWLKYQEQGFSILAQLFQKNTYAPAFIQSLNNLQKNILLHRKQNFIGAMLQHHTIQSTKYMALWIESKNKNVVVNDTSNNN